jgi:heme a synthase
MAANSSTHANDASGNIALRWFSRVLVLLTLFLIFMGGQVKSHEAGLSVPDWPTTFGENMFTYAPSNWVGGIFHEHTHRLVASSIGFLTIVLAIWLTLTERRRWVKGLGWFALAAVIAQGLLGGLTVILMLPAWVSIAHGILAQTFLMITILIAYTQSKEWDTREASDEPSAQHPLFKPAMVMTAAVYVQLFLGALMRHTESGLAIPDFPMMTGQWIPFFTEQSADWVNAWRTDYAFETGVVLEQVTLAQVWVHFIHRLGALMVVFALAQVLVVGWKNRTMATVPGKAVVVLTALVALQISLGIATVLSLRIPIIASLHVVTGAATLGFSWLILLRAMPLQLWDEEPSPLADDSTERIATRPQVNREKTV